MLAELPLEILDSIAQHLDLPSARALALTCHATRKAAETIIWTNVICDLNYDELSHLYDDDQDILEEWTEILTSKYQLAADALSSYPPRKLAARYFKLGVTPDLGHTPRDILDLIGPSLTELHIETYWDETATSRGLVPRLNSLYDTDRRFPRMEGVTQASAHFAIPHIGQHLSTFFLSVPNVEQLKLVICQWPRGDTSEFVSSRDTPIQPTAKLDRLSHLSLDIDLADVEALDMILKHTMCTVTHLTLFREYELNAARGGEESDDEIVGASRSDLILETIRSMEHLVYLEWYLDVDVEIAIHKLYKMCDKFPGPGLPKLKTLVMRSIAYSEEDTDIHDFLIPRVHNLEEVINPCRTEQWQGTETHPSRATMADSDGLIPAHTVDRLRECLKFGTIIFSATSDPDRNPSTWCHKRINGSIIRSYSNGVDDMFHIRRLELLNVDPKLYDEYDPEFTYECDGGTDHVWKDQTYFEGREVPIPILDQIYQMIGEKRTWSTPGRELKLPDEAWTLLKKAREEM